MRSVIRYIDPSYQLTNKKGIALNHFRIFLQEVYRSGLLIGTGSPEGVVEAAQGQEYMDEEGVAGAVKYIKQVNDIDGDRTSGWVAIG